MLNSIEPHISSLCIYLLTTKDIWDNHNHLYAQLSFERNGDCDAFIDAHDVLVIPVGDMEVKVVVVLVVDVILEVVVGPGRTWK